MLPAARIHRDRAAGSLVQSKDRVNSMANIVTNLRALAAGVQAFQDTRAGRAPEDQDGADEMFARPLGYADRLTAVNPWLTEEQSLTLERVIRGMVDSVSVTVPRYPGSAFLVVRDTMAASSLLVADSGQTRETLDKGVLFEVARIAHRLFADDTTPDAMWGLDANLRYERNGLALDLAAEVHAYMDAAFSGDLERAVSVAEAVAASGVTTFKKPEDKREDLESQMRRTFAGILVMEMAGTLAAQITPDLVPDIDERPIGGAATADPFATPEDD